MTEAVPHVPFQPPAALAITWLLAALCLSLLLQGCTTHRPSAAVLEAPAGGYSGMAQLDPTTYLVAHDVKSAAPRFGLLHATRRRKMNPWTPLIGHHRSTVPPMWRRSAPCPTAAC